jgi:hypothetical protein
MKKLIIPCIAAALVNAISHAAPADDVAAAAKKLSEAPSYSWTSTSETGNAQGNAGPIEGMTEKGGFTVTKASFNGNSVQSVRKGEKTVRLNQDGAWMTTEEMAAARGAGGAGGGGGGGGGRGRGGFGGPQINPAEDVTAIVAQAKNLTTTDGAISGELSEEAVGQRLNRGGRGGAGGGGGGGGQPPAAPKNASGSVKIWLKDGVLAKYQVHVKGTVAGRNGDQERDVTTTVEIKNVGSTKVEVPEEAKKKLGA